MHAMMLLMDHVTDERVSHRIDESLRRAPGVRDVKISTDQAAVRIELDDDAVRNDRDKQRLIELVENTGVGVERIEMSADSSSP